MPLPAGQRLAQYEIIQAIGAGGMGEVYRARDSRLGRDVAIKVMASHIAADPDMRSRFETEARAVASLSHPSILGIHELAVVDGRPMAVMELLEGENLRSRLRRGPMGWRDAVSIAAAVAEGLAAAHQRGIVHRDLKPENIFLCTDGGVKILDFGLALERVDSALSADSPTISRTVEGVVLGTFGYMSPEQVTGARVDGRSDIFALGCVIYEMLAGRPLFTGATPQEVIAHVLHDSVPELSAFDPLAPNELRAIVSRCVDREPSRRFESAQDVVMALRALLSGSSAAIGARRARPRGKSLAVLPFVNAGADPSVEYLTDGITESIINSLSQLSGLRVVPRSLVFRYKGLQADPATIGLALNARTILTGRVLQQGDQINIQAELVDTANESQLWGEQFRQPIEDLVTLQQEISWQISEALRLRLSGAQKKRLRRKAKVDPAAYQEYLRGRYHWNNWTPDSFRRAIEAFERAIAIDPTFAGAYAGLGYAIGSLTYYGLIKPEDGFPRSKAAARRAAELDPELADAYVSLGLGCLFWDHDWIEAERNFKKALQLNPQLPAAHALYALFLATVGQFDAAIESARKGQELDPLSLLNNMSVCWALHFAGRYEETITETKRTMDLSPGFHDAGKILMISYEHLGRFEDAARTAGSAVCFGKPDDAEELLQAYRSEGARGYWRKRLEMLERPTGLSELGMLNYAFAVIYSHLGETDKALERIERLIEGKAGGAVFLGVDPCLSRLRDEPRYRALMKQVGVPTVSAPHTVST